ncbi:MAG TPA: 50S ribosomal protein L29 [Methanothrix sp.]|nr:50S ribosomal protein L29 [Methanothrix sp.]
MAIFRVDELRNMSPEELGEELEKLKSELIRERGLVVSGGAPENPGRIREIKRSIARIKTIQKERALT